MRLSAALATYNEESNIEDCLQSVKPLVDEIIVVDGSSSDKTVDLAKKFGAKVYIKKNHPIFHINKQKAFDLCRGEWILSLDADERVTPSLAKEIREIIHLSNKDIEEYENKMLVRFPVFLRHQRLLEKRDGSIGNTQGEYVAFFFPRLNYFLGHYLRYGGVYPDGVIRLFKKGYAYLPCKDVHEQMTVKGKVGWLKDPLLHIDSPNFERYLYRNNRYIELVKLQLKEDKVGKNIPLAFDFFLVKPILWFLTTQIRHKGILDGIPGMIFSLFSALRYPRAYWRYLKDK